MRKEKKATYYLAFDGFSLAVDHGVRCNDAERSRVRLNYLELHGTHASAHQEYITLVYRPVRLQKVRLQVDLKQISATFSISLTTISDVKLPDSNGCSNIQNRDLFHTSIRSCIGKKS